jgi:hypothetical protein
MTPQQEDVIFPLAALSRHFTEVYTSLDMLGSQILTTPNNDARINKLLSYAKAMKAVLNS